MVYYNEIDPYAAQWLRNLIAAGHIANGEVDERSIQLVDSADLADFTQCHFFAGVGVWSYALRLAGWPDDRPVWTGSCPCQPFSAAGKGAGFADERHLWPEFFRLIQQRRPPVVFGEQVASKDGLEWLDLVQADLERASYTSAAADLCAAGVGAPHIRQRLYWVAYAQGERREPFAHVYAARVQRAPIQQAESLNGLGDLCAASGRVANANNAGSQGHRQSGAVNVSQGRADQGRYCAENSLVGGLADAESQRQCADQLGRDCRNGVVVAGAGSRCDGGYDGESGGLADSARSRHREHERDCGTVGSPRSGDEGQKSQLGWLAQAVRDCSEDVHPSSINGHWRDADWLYCRDGKWRPVEPGTFPLAYGAAARVGRLRAYGNAIVPQAAQTFIEAFMECRP